MPMKTPRQWLLTIKRFEDYLQSKHEKPAIDTIGKGKGSFPPHSQPKQ